MKQVQQYLGEVAFVIERAWYAFSAADVLIQLALVVALLSLLISLMAWFRAKRLSQEGSAYAVQQSVQELSVRLYDLEGRINIRAPQVAPERTAAPVITAAEGKKKSRKSVQDGLSKSRSRFFGKLSEIFAKDTSSNEELYSGIEELLITNDFGVATTSRLIDTLKAAQTANAEESFNEDRLLEILRSDLEQTLSSDSNSELLADKVDGAPRIVLIVGVNGVGKTTTIGKLASKFKAEGKSVLVAACDTFRAAAVEQLKIWGERADVPVISGAADAKPSTVAYDAVHRAISDQTDVVLVDTAGRLHTRKNLMNELQSIVKLIGRELPGAPHDIVLVLDASTGQNALQQAREFNQMAKLSGVIVTKLDGTAKGGIVVAIKEELGVPIRYLGVGESAEDLRPFIVKEFVSSLLNKGEISNPVEASSTAPARVRRRRREPRAPA